MWLAVKMKDRGMLESVAATAWLKRVSVFSCAAVAVVMCYGTWRGQMRTGKMPRRMYDEALRVRRENPQYADAKFYFTRNAPYSAEFYLRGDVRVHEVEDAAASVANSGQDFLFMSKNNFECLAETPERAVVYENKKWLLFAPENKQP